MEGGENVSKKNAMFDLLQIKFRIFSNINFSAKYFIKVTDILSQFWQMLLGSFLAINSEK